MKTEFTAQQVFNKVVRHLRKQGVRATQPEDGRYICKYRTGEGLRCAVGCFIRPDVYSSEMEGNNIDELTVFVFSRNQKSRLASLLSKHHGLLVNLQQCHDQIVPGSWEVQFKKLAQLYVLKVPK